MRCYLPYCVQDLLPDARNEGKKDRTIAAPSGALVWADTAQLRAALPDPTWAEEEYEDLAMTLAGFYSLLLPSTLSPSPLGRLVVAVDLTQEEIEWSTCRLPFAAGKVKTPIKWQHAVSIHADLEQLVAPANRLRRRLNLDRWEYLLFETPDLESTEVQKNFAGVAATEITQIGEDWETLLNESLQWFDICEKEKLAQWIAKESGYCKTKTLKKEKVEKETVKKGIIAVKADKNNNGNETGKANKADTATLENPTQKINFTPGKPAIIVSLTAGNQTELEAQLATIPDNCDLIEWRIDHFLAASQKEINGQTANATSLAGKDSTGAGRQRTNNGTTKGKSPNGTEEFAHLAEIGIWLQDKSQKPILATLRTKAEGGEIAVSEQYYFDCLSYLMQRKSSNLIDLEATQPSSNKLVKIAQNKEIGVVYSKHHFSPSAAGKYGKQQILDYFRYAHNQGAQLAKIALYCVDSTHLLEIFQASQEYSLQYGAEKPILAIAMGEKGSASRLVGGCFGNSATFAARPAKIQPDLQIGQTGTQSAPGQVDYWLTEKVLSVLGQRE